MNTPKPDPNWGKWRHEPVRRTGLTIIPAKPELKADALERRRPNPKHNVATDNSDRTD